MCTSKQVLQRLCDPSTPSSSEQWLTSCNLVGAARSLRARCDGHHHPSRCGGNEREINTWPRTTYRRADVIFTLG